MSLRLFSPITCRGSRPLLLPAVPNVGAARMKWTNTAPKSFHRPYTQQVPKQALVARYQKHGIATEVVKLNNEDLPSVPPTGVAVKMLYAPVNPADINMLSGTYQIQPTLPAVGGSEGLGEVIAVGSESKLKVGDLVVPARPTFGTWRTHAVCQDDDLVALPPAAKNIADKEILSVLTTGPPAAHRMLNDFAELKSGDVIIQNGANSLVGICLLQMATARGIKSINILRKRPDLPQVIEKLKQYGGTVVVSDEELTSTTFKKAVNALPQPKLALNCIGGPTTSEMARLLCPNGTMVTYGGMSFKPVTIPTRSFIFNNILCRGFWITRWYESHTLAERQQLISDVLPIIEQNKLTVPFEKHTLDTVNNAIQRSINSNTRDKKVLLAF